MWSFVHQAADIKGFYIREVFQCKSCPSDYYITAFISKQGFFAFKIQDARCNFKMGTQQKSVNSIKYIHHFTVHISHYRFSLPLFSDSFILPFLPLLQLSRGKSSWFLNRWLLTCHSQPVIGHRGFYVPQTGTLICENRKNLYEMVYIVLGYSLDYTKSEVGWGCSKRYFVISGMEWDLESLAHKVLHLIHLKKQIQSFLVSLKKKIGWCQNRLKM